MQRTGRNRPERDADGAQPGRRAVWRGVALAIIGGILLVEVWLGIILGVLPR